MATAVRTYYTPPFTRAVGEYVPQLLDPSLLPGGEDGFPIPLLEGDGVSVSSSVRSGPTAYALRNVHADELHFVVEGGGRLETDFGVLDLVAGDFVLLPRAVTYRYGAIVAPLHELVFATDSRLVIDPDFGVLNVDLHVDSPVPDPTIDRGAGEHELRVLHGGQTTSYFYDHDPLPCVAVVGAPVIQRFNFSNLHVLTIDVGARPPGRIINDESTKSLFYNLSSRRCDRPPAHHNADYDEIYVYTAGPANYGAISKPGTIAWTPKGIVHHGPEEDIPEGYKAILFETRANIALTPAGRSVAKLAETADFATHPSVATSR